MSVGIAREHGRQRAKGRDRGRIEEMRERMFCIILCFPNKDIALNKIYILFSGPYSSAAGVKASVVVMAIALILSYVKV